MEQDSGQASVHDTEKGNGNGGDRGIGKDIVEIFVNDILVYIHRGHQTGASIKAAAMAVNGTDVSSVDVLYEMPDYKEISDSESLVIHGEERFKTTPPDGSSS
jgi:hypothetical protein